MTNTLTKIADLREKIHRLEKRIKLSEDYKKLKEIVAELDVLEARLKSSLVEEGGSE